MLQLLLNLLLHRRRRQRRRLLRRRLLLLQLLLALLLMLQRPSLPHLLLLIVRPLLLSFQLILPLLVLLLPKPRAARLNTPLRRRRRRLWRHSLRCDDRCRLFGQRPDGQVGEDAELGAEGFDLGVRRFDLGVRGRELGVKPLLRLERGGKLGGLRLKLTGAVVVVVVDDREHGSARAWVARRVDSGGEQSANERRGWRRGRAAGSGGGGGRGGVGGEGGGTDLQPTLINETNGTWKTNGTRWNVTICTGIQISTERAHARWKLASVFCLISDSGRPSSTPMAPK